MVLSYFGGIAQLARASALQAEGRRFDSDYLHYGFGQLHENVAAFFIMIIRKITNLPTKILLIRPL